MWKDYEFKIRKTNLKYIDLVTKKISKNINELAFVKQKKKGSHKYQNGRVSTGLERTEEYRLNATNSRSDRSF